jgi:hypothetical protein
VLALNLSFRSVENKQFCRYLKFLRPAIETPTARMVRVDLDIHFAEVRLNIKSQIPSDAKVSVALDAWTSPNRLSFLAVVIYFIDIDWKYQEVLIGFAQIEGEHSGANLARILSRILEDYGLEDRVFGLTTDNASNNDTLAENLENEITRPIANNLTAQVRDVAKEWNAEQMHVPCMAHVVQLVVKAFINGIKASATNDEISRATVTDQELHDVIAMTGGFQKTLTKVKTSFLNVLATDALKTPSFMFPCQLFVSTFARRSFLASFSTKHADSSVCRSGLLLRPSTPLPSAWKSSNHYRKPAS